MTESYYDNITLSSNAKNKELVTQILPGFSLSKKSRRIQLTSDYAFGYTKYFGDDFSDSSFNRANVTLTAEAIRKHLYFNADASVSQQVVDPSQSFSNDAALITNNKTETRTIGLQPRLTNRIGAYANSDLSYKYTLTNYSSNALGDSRQSSIQYNLTSGRWFKRLNWFANATHLTSNQENADNSAATLRVNYDLSQHWTMFLLSRAQVNNYQPVQLNTSRYYINPEAGVVWTASRKLKIEAGGGAVLNARDLSNNKITIDQPTWRAIVNLKPSSRTSFSFGREAAAYGDRNFLDFSHNTRHTNWTAGYAETLITPQQLRIASVANAATPGALVSGGELGRAVTNDVILRKRLDLGASITRRKVTIGGSGFQDKGEYQTSNTTDKRYGINGNVDVNIGRSMSWTNLVSGQRYYFENGSRADNIYTFNTALSKKLKKHISTSLDYQWQKRSAPVANAQYTAQQINARLDVTF